MITYADLRTASENGKSQAMFSATASQKMTRKEFCASRGMHPSTLRRWERQGLTVIMGRITEQDVAFWAEQRDAARALGMKVLEFMAQPREQREKLLAEAHRLRCSAS